MTFIMQDKRQEVHQDFKVHLLKRLKNMKILMVFFFCLLLSPSLLMFFKSSCEMVLHDYDNWSNNDFVNSESKETNKLMSLKQHYKTSQH